MLIERPGHRNERDHREALETFRFAVERDRGHADGFLDNRRYLVLRNETDRRIGSRRKPHLLEAVFAQRNGGCGHASYGWQQ